MRDPSAKVAAGASLALDLPPLADPIPAGEDLALVIVHEDDDLVVVDKPAVSSCIPRRATPAAPW